MKLIIQLASLLGIIISASYLYRNSWDFAGGTTLLSFIALFAGSFFLFKQNKKPVNQSQKVGKNSTAYQSGGDMNIGGKS